MLRRGGSFGATVWGNTGIVPGVALLQAELDAAGAPLDNPLSTYHDLIDEPAKLIHRLADAGFTTARVSRLDWGRPA